MIETINLNNDEIVMKLLGYFITEKKYTPVVIRGLKDEIWLENMDENYKIIRIVSRYIHNNEQLELDVNRASHLAKVIKKRTLSFKMEVLSIFVNLGDNVELNKYDNLPKMDVALINDTKDLNNYNFIINSFPDIMNKTKFKEKGMELFMKITGDIAEKNRGEAQMNEEIFSIKKPIITIALIVINIMIYLFTNNYVVYEFGVSKEGILNGEFYRLFTGMFLHGGIFHIVFNMYALYIIGTQLESFLGKAKFLLVYLLGGVAGSALSAFLTDGLSVGASSAIFGLLGSLLYFGYHHRVYLETVVKSQIIPLIIINLLIGLSPGIDNWAHIGGLIGGIFATMAVGLKYKTTKVEMVNGILLYVVFVGAILFMTFQRMM